MVTNESEKRFDPNLTEDKNQSTIEEAHDAKTKELFPETKIADKSLELLSNLLEKLSRYVKNIKDMGGKFFLLPEKFSIEQEQERKTLGVFNNELVWLPKKAYREFFNSNRETMDKFVEVAELLELAFAHLKDGDGYRFFGGVSRFVQTRGEATPPTDADATAVRWYKKIKRENGVLIQYGDWLSNADQFRENLKKINQSRGKFHNRIQISDPTEYDKKVVGGERVAFILNPPNAKRIRRHKNNLDKYIKPDYVDCEVYFEGNKNPGPATGDPNEIGGAFTIGNKKVRHTTFCVPAPNGVHLKMAGKDRLCIESLTVLANDFVNKLKENHVIKRIVISALETNITSVKKLEDIKKIMDEEGILDSLHPKIKRAIIKFVKRAKNFYASINEIIDNGPDIEKPVNLDEAAKQLKIFYDKYNSVAEIKEHLEELTSNDNIIMLPQAMPGHSKKKDIKSYLNVHTAALEIVSEKSADPLAREQIMQLKALFMRSLRAAIEQNNPYDIAAAATQIQNIEYRLKKASAAFVPKSEDIKHS